MTTPDRAVVLLSGGLDSATCLAIARDLGFECHALSIAYGQRHTAELAAAPRVAAALGAREHRLAEVGLGAFGGSALTDASIAVPVDAVDYSGYPDCRPEFIAAFEAMANLATKAGVEGARITIHAPLIHLSKAEIITRGTALGVDYARTVSCYQADAAGNACGICDACRLRKAGFEAAGIPDPTRYR